MGHEETKFMVGAILIIITVFVAIGMKKSMDYINARVYGDEYCKLNGYKKVTDYNVERYAGTGALSKTIVEYDIECDNKKIYYSLFKVDKCIRKNKWGDCVESQTVIR